MNCYIQHLETGEFFSNGLWVADPRKAEILDFEKLSKVIPYGDEFLKFTPVTQTYMFASYVDSLGDKMAIVVGI